MLWKNLQTGDRNLSKVLDITLPPYSLKYEGISVPPPKKDILKGVLVIIILAPYIVKSIPLSSPKKESNLSFAN